MITPTVQRWRGRRASYRPAGEPIATRDYEVAAIDDDTTARAFVVANHYSATYPAARFRFGLYRSEEIVGVAVFSHPANEKTLDVLPGAGLERTELGRFVLTDDVPANGETWFLGRAFEELRRKGLAGVVSFSDPVARATSAGDVVFPGHVGTIYQAHNARYLGRGARATLYLLPDGTNLGNRALQKVRGLERGWRYVADRIIAAGAPEPRRFEAPKEWLARVLPLVVRTAPHAGNHKYAWALRARDRRHLPAGLPYPKIAPLALRGAA